VIIQNGVRTDGTPACSTLAEQDLASVPSSFADVIDSLADQRLEARIKRLAALHSTDTQPSAPAQPDPNGGASP